MGKDLKTVDETKETIMGVKKVSEISDKRDFRN
jgi:hypothetical protein